MDFLQASATPRSIDRNLKKELRNIPELHADEALN
jgi:hypothetical protein